MTWLLEQASLSSANYRPAPLLRRLPACLRALHVTTLTEAQALLVGQPELRPRALSTILIGVTEFFRDREAFETLQEQVLPELLTRRAAAGQAGLRVWSVGCSDGAELYSVAMLLDQRGGLAASDLLGTDCRPCAVSAARAGCYRADVLAKLEPALRLAYFAPHGTDCRVIERLRSRVRWHLHDALTPPPAGPWDLILCRNMSIYLDPAAVGRLWAALAGALVPGGVLMVGRAEKPGVASLVRLAPSLYQCADGPYSGRQRVACIGGQMPPGASS